MTAPKHSGMSEIPHPHAAHLPYLPEPRQWLGPFCMLTSGSVIFRKRCRFNLLYNTGGGLEKCCIYIGRVDGPEMGFLRYIIRDRPLYTDFCRSLTTTSCGIAASLSSLSISSDCWGLTRTNIVSEKLDGSFQKSRCYRNTPTIY